MDGPSMGCVFQADEIGAWISFLFLFKIFVYFYFSVALGLRCGEQAFSRCGEQGLLSSCREQASHCGGFSSRGAWPPDARASAVAAPRL